MQAQRRLLLSACAAVGLAAAAGRIAVRAQPTPRVIPITASKFKYEPSEIALKLGEKVIFRLTTLDVVMGFSVPDFGVRGTVVPGQTTDVAMTPTKTGDFTFLCDVFCGSGHENMDGTLHVAA